VPVESGSRASQGPSGPAPGAESGGVGPLAGIRVVDLTRARAGPTCTRQLSDFGASVVHVVDPRGGDLLGNSDAANLHRNKRSVALDLHHPDGAAALLRLTDGADVFVENMRPGVKRRLGIGPDVLLARNPRLVYASLSGFGQTGPYADRPGLDQVAQGMGGLMSVTGPPGSGPWRVGIAISDTASGTFLTQGVLAALFARERTGRGQWIQTSLLESMVNFMDFQACRWLSDGVVPEQEGNDHPTIFPMGAYRCADGWINIAGAMALERFLDVIGARELLDDTRFADADSRRANRVAFNDACDARLVTETGAHWVERLNAASIAAGPVYAVDEVFADPQVRHLDLEQVVEGDDGRPVHVLRHPVTFGDTPTSIRSGPVRGGTHTREVLAEVGYADAEIDALVASGAANQAKRS
jgi:crotonobetainyl-CoA:carnitine CoA-transferase CaiB-like acyl-CoA transferase